MLAAATLKGEMLEQVAEARPDVIFISAMPPGTGLENSEQTPDSRR